MWNQLLMTLLWINLVVQYWFVTVCSGGRCSSQPRRFPLAPLPPTVQSRPSGAPPRQTTLQELLHRRPQAQGQETRRVSRPGQGEGIRLGAS